ncbi:site-specific DNA-methyltransferase [Acinetobacter bereziniae]|uniref:site-specific DNA-methyltransferase n=1 Tax=Acinetobacter bereziniae TaxID=106648 RepID=UPI0021CEBEC3|nr:site-specific DNA-methyltransferase [Acinetobacter bereziniae]MCU4416238.1 site-specific DNA-methyltransferase [Acinetobacter bereziniae]
MNFINAKLNSYEQVEGTNLYPYYAGFSYKFVKYILNDISDSNITVLDPWAGTGITNIIANSLGLQSLGIDINPVMTIISKASLVSETDLQEISDDFLLHVNYDDVIESEDPLKQWFSEQTSKTLRNIQKFITSSYSIYKDEFNYYSEVTCFYLLVLFAITKKSVKQKFSSSNPTWIKVAKAEDEKITLSKDEIIDLLKNELLNCMNKQRKNAHFVSSTKTNFYTASSLALPIPDNTIDFVLTSPPYCTRIDYAVSMKPELAILNFRTNQEFRKLRRNIIGTTTVEKKIVEPQQNWGESCLDFLDNVKKHESRASSTYYYKNHTQYFNCMYHSLVEIYRVMKSGGKFILVVQNSYYKEFLNDIAKYLTEMSLNIGFKLVEQRDFPIKSISSINKNSIKYKNLKENFESIIILNK